MLARRLLLLAALVLSAPTAALAQAVRFPGPVWETAPPAVSRWSERRLGQVHTFFNSMGSTALVIIHDGRIVASWGDLDVPVKIHSVRKSLLSALFGIAVDRGQVHLDQTLAQLKIDDNPPSLTAIEKSAKVRDLLQARSGIYHKAAAETKSMERLRPPRGSHRPGTFFYYNNWDFNALATILRQVSGEDTFVAMEQSLARPLQMQRFTAKDGEHVNVPASSHPAYHMKFTALDLARFGWLVLNRGRWGNQQIIPAAWVAESTRVWTPEARRGVGYGYMWWVSMNDRLFRTTVGPGSFSARGNGGQYIVVAPSRRTVVIHLNDRSETDRLESGEFNELMQLIFAAAPR